MSKQPKRGELSKATIVKRILATGCGPSTSASSGTSAEELSTANKNWLLLEAVRRGALTREEADPAKEYTNIVVKRYLRSAVSPEKDAAFLGALDEYVSMMSRIRAAGSKLGNLFAMRAYDNDDLALDDSFLDQTFVKWMLLPFKGAVSGAAQATPPHPGLSALWAEFEPLLRPTYPTSEELRRMPWDQALSDAAREYIGAFRSHVMVHFATRVTGYVRSVILDELGTVVRTDRETGRKTGTLDGATFFMSDVYAYLENAKVPTHALALRIVELVDGIRTLTGLAGASRLSKATLTVQVFRFHVTMSRYRERRGERAWSAAPVVKTHRTFAYLDDRVVEGIARGFGCRPSRGAQTFAVALGVDRASWNAANKTARRLRRRGVKNRRSLCGSGSMPRDWVPTSACTDGVAICVTLARPVEPKGPGEVASKKAVKASYQEEVQRFAALHQGVKIHGIADDPGCVAPSQTAQLDEFDRGFVHTRLSRRQLRTWTLQDRQRKAEIARRKASPLLRLAISSLSERTWRTTILASFVGTLVVQRMVDDILVTEYIADDWYARWKMLLWRRKRSTVMQYFVSTIRLTAEKVRRATSRRL